MTGEDRLANLVRQHAETSRLLGVDFVPVYARARLVEPKPAPLDSPPDPVPVLGDAPPARHAPIPPASARPAAPAPDAPAAVGLFHVADAAPAPAPIRRDPAESQRRLDELRERYEREAPHRHFTTAHTRIVFGEGDPCARLVFVGEAPGAEEDRTGRPFVGRAGQLLNRMIEAMGLERERVYICNVLKTRPPDNATPTIEEARLCAPYLFEQIAIIAPEVIVALGLPAARTLLDSDESMSRLRGRFHVFIDPAGRRVPVMPTYHPAFLLRSYTPDNRRKVWSDLKLVVERLAQPPANFGQVHA